MRDETWIIVLIILAGIGILLTIIFEVYLMSKIIGDPFIKHWRTMWLGQQLLLAVFLCYLTLFAFVPTPTKYTCGIIRYVLQNRHVETNDINMPEDLVNDFFGCLRRSLIRTFPQPCPMFSNKITDLNLTLSKSSQIWKYDCDHPIY